MAMKAEPIEAWRNEVFRVHDLAADIDRAIAFGSSLVSIDPGKQEKLLLPWNSNEILCDVEHFSETEWPYSVRLRINNMEKTVHDQIAWIALHSRCSKDPGFIIMCPRRMDRRSKKFVYLREIENKKLHELSEPLQQIAWEICQKTILILKTFCDQQQKDSIVGKKERTGKKFLDHQAAAALLREQLGIAKR